MTRAITLSSGGGTVAIGRTSGIQFLRGLKGTGLPPVQPQFFEGAGDGATWRGTRVLARTQDIPFKITGADRNAVWANFETLGKVFAPTAGEVRMAVVLDGEEWYNTFVRTGGGDFSWDTDTDGTSFIKTVISVKAGDPYFTRTNATSQAITLGGLGRGLLKGTTSLSKLQLSTNNSLGSVALFNPGSVGAYPLWTIKGPFDSFQLTSPSGEVLEWDGPNALITDTLTVDFELGTIVDQTGANKYGSLIGIPNFWAIPPGTNVAEVELINATSDSRVTIFFNPKRWVMF